jgi:hypothetical protein
MAYFRYPQISLEDYQLFRKFMLPGEFPATHEQWVESIEKQKRNDAVECLTHEGSCNVEIQPDAFKKYCADTNEKPTAEVLDRFIRTRTL